MNKPESDSLRSGTCPKCGGKEVYTNSELPDRGDRRQLAVSSFKCILISSIVCTNCGYFEEYIPEKELKNEEIIDKLRSTWKKI